MTIATLAQVLQPALSGNYAVAGLVVLGWEDAECFVAAATKASLPVILQAGPGVRKHIPLPVLGAMFRHLAEQTEVPVVCHLDHGFELDEIRMAIDAGFSSVMIDGSRMPFADNIKLTSAAATLAHEAGLSIEAEIGFVGSQDGDSSESSDPNEAEQLASAVALDALAISVGNLHLQTEQRAPIDLAALARIEQRVSCPLVLHGGSGIPRTMRQHLARNTAVCKFNIGTELRLIFGSGLRSYLVQHPNSFDRLEILQSLGPALVEKAGLVIRELSL